MKVKDLIKELQGIENPEKKIHLLGNEINGEDESTDIIFDILEIWDDGDESITLFLTNKKIDYERVEREEEEREWLKRVSLYKHEKKENNN